MCAMLGVIHPETFSTTGSFSSAPRARTLATFILLFFLVKPLPLQHTLLAHISHHKWLSYIFLNEIMFFISGPWSHPVKSIPSHEALAPVPSHLIMSLKSWAKRLHDGSLRFRCDLAPLNQVECWKVDIIRRACIPLHTMSLAFTFPGSESCLDNSETFLCHCDVLPIKGQESMLTLSLPAPSHILRGQTGQLLSVVHLLCPMNSFHIKVSFVS